MPSKALLHRALSRALFLGLAAFVASCGSTPQKMDLSPDMLATPPHRMSRSEYPFDARGRYVDAWAAEGAGRYGRGMNTDRTEDGRLDTPEPERRPLPPPSESATTPPAPPPRTSTAGSRPPAPPRPDTTISATTSTQPTPAPPKKSESTKPGTSSATKPATKPATKASPAKSSTSKSSTAKPTSKKTPAKKPAAKKKSTSHTVGKGDSLTTLSRRYGVSVQALKKANNLKSDRIIDGRKLVIPKN